MEQLARNLVAATSVKAVVDVLEAFEANHSPKRVPVGRRENNLATINIGSDPAAGLIERVTNAIDAVLEREWQAHGEPSNIRSPRQGVEEWFGIEGGRLASVENARDKTIRAVSERVTVTLHDSGQAAAPTADVRDQGVGLLAQDFGDSILSLNETRKLKKFFLAGAFGQGGSTALAYSEYTIIISRRAGLRDDGAPHPVAFTIVEFDEGDLDRDKHGVYEYIVDPRTGHPFTVQLPLDEFAEGTLVRHVSMDLGKYTGVMTGPSRSLWYLAHHYLFDPVMPFRIEEQRDNSSKGENRFVGGNARRLHHGDLTQYKREARLTFRTGSVRLTWWVLAFEKPASGNADEKKKKSKQNPKDFIRNYTLPSKPVVITFNGQKQGELPNTLIKNQLGLPYLERFLVVHVDCDDLDNESRRQLFPTTREKLRDISLLDNLRDLVVDTLRGDDQLKLLDRQRRQRYMERVDDESVIHLRKRLANRIKTFTNVGAGTGPRDSDEAEGSDDSSEPKAKPAIPVQDPPTFLEITTTTPKKVRPGRSFNLKFKTDAHPAYFVDPDAFIAVVTPPAVAQYTGTTTVHEGYGTAFFKVSDEAEVGTEAEITLELRPKGAKSLADSAGIEVVPIPEGAGTGQGDAATPNINPIFVDKDSQYWKDNGWDDSYVAKVDRGDDSIDVYVSAENKKLTKVIARAQRRGMAQVTAFKQFYLEHICFHALLADLAETDAPVTEEVAADAEGGDADDGGVVAEQRELMRACETICGIMESMFDLIATGAHESA